VKVTGRGEEVFCKDMLKNDQWKGKHIVKRHDDPIDASNNSWWGCWYPYAWHEGRCVRSIRYLGETCWRSSWSGSGICAGSDYWYREYSTSCHHGKCVPFAWAEDRVPCECSWLGWNLVIACTSKEHKCSGHACVWDSKDGGKYCDWASGQHW